MRKLIDILYQLSLCLTILFCAFLILFGLYSLVSIADHTYKKRVIYPEVENQIRSIYNAIKHGIDISNKISVSYKSPATQQRFFNSVKKSLKYVLYPIEFDTEYISCIILLVNEDVTEAFGVWVIISSDFLYLERNYSITFS